MTKRTIRVEGLGGKRRLDLATLLAPMVDDELRRRLLAKWAHEGGPITLDIHEDRHWNRLVRRMRRQAKRAERREARRSR